MAVEYQLSDVRLFSGCQGPTPLQSVLARFTEAARQDLAQATVTLREIPHVVLGPSKLQFYEFNRRTSVHGQIQWEEGIWSELGHRFSSCRRRGCLVLLQIDPRTRRQMYQHGDPGPMIEIDPARGEFMRLIPWLEACHEGEDLYTTAPIISEHRPPQAGESSLLDSVARFLGQFKSARH